MLRNLQHLVAEMVISKASFVLLKSETRKEDIFVKILQERALPMSS